MGADEQQNYLGRLKLDTWEQDGQKRSKLRIVGDRLTLMPKGDKLTPPKPQAPKPPPAEIPF